MSALITGSIRVDRLPKEKFIKGKDGAVYYNLTISIGDETRFGNNVAFMDSQTKEERDAKVAKTYLGNGKVVWIEGVTNGKGTIHLAEKEDVNNIETVAETITETVDSDLPF
tara:strand:- start:256 stop:591 length:336 start_codon:yes stop_codon:yes gene_type:complete